MLFIVDKYQAKDIADRLYEARCFSIGQGSETVSQIRQKLDDVTTFGVIEIVLALVGGVIQLYAVGEDWEESKKAAEEQEEGATDEEQAMVAAEPSVELSEDRHSIRDKVKQKHNNKLSH